MGEIQRDSAPLFGLFNTYHTLALQAYHEAEEMEKKLTAEHPEIAARWLRLIRLRHQAVVFFSTAERLSHEIACGDEEEEGER